MFDVCHRKIIREQVPDHHERIPVCGAENEKVNYGSCFKIEAHVWQEKKEGRRTVFVKPAAAIE